MLEELLKYNSLGSKEELILVMFNGLSDLKYTPYNDIRKFCTSSLFSIGSSFNGIIKLLEYTAIVKNEDENLIINDKIFKRNLCSPNLYFERPHFLQLLFDTLKNDSELNNLFNPDVLRYDASRDLYYFRNEFIPYRFLSLRNLLISIGFFTPDDVNSDILILESKFKEFFIHYIDWVINFNEKIRFKKLSLDELKEKNKLNEELGKLAEEFVIEHEKSRLKGHISLDKVQRISEEFNNAGYDIQSFNSVESVLVDRFIEVKSYIHKVEFFWSSNQIELAKDLKDSYFLYLVDRSRINDSNYYPKIISNPYEKVFKSDFWKTEVDKWKIIYNIEIPSS